MYTVDMKNLNLHHLGIQVFLGNVDSFLDPKIRPLHSPGG